MGLLTALAAATQLFAGPAWGVVADRFPSSRLVVPIPALVAAVGAGGLALAHSPAAVAVAAIALFLASGGVLPILDSRALEAVGDDRDRYGRLRVWGSISFIASVWIVGALIDWTGTRGLFLVYVPALLATALVTFALPRGAAVAGTRFGPLRAVLTERSLSRFLVAALVAWTALTLTTSFFSIYLVSLGAPAVLVGAAWGLGALVEVPIMWAFPALAARLGTERLLIAGAALFSARAFAVAFFTEPLVLVAVSAVSGAGFALFLVGGVTYVSRHSPPGAAATAQGVFTGGSFGLAMIIGSGVGGALAEAVGIRGMFQLAAWFSVLGVLAVVVAVRSVARARLAAVGPPAPASGGVVDGGWPEESAAK